MGPLLLVLLLVVPAAGCLELEAARVPDLLLEGRGGNGWARNETASDDAPASRQMGFVKTQTLAYEDRTSDEGYDGSLSVATLRTLLRPSEESLRAQMQERVRDEATAKGIRIEGAAATGTRTLKNGAESYWFVYNGTVERAGFFSSDARVKLLGEVFQCLDERTVVVVVGLAQLTETRSVGGVPIQGRFDDTTWKEIASDPRGRVDGARGSNGLVYNLVC